MLLSIHSFCNVIRIVTGILGKRQELTCCNAIFKMTAFISETTEGVGCWAGRRWRGVFLPHQTVPFFASYFAFSLRKHNHKKKRAVFAMAYFPLRALFIYFNLNPHLPKQRQVLHPGKILTSKQIQAPQWLSELRAPFRHHFRCKPASFLGRF